MKEGLLWYESGDFENVEEKVASAVKFFTSKYGYLPEKCYVNPKVLVTEQLELKIKVKVLPNDRVITNHIWLEFPKR